MHIIHYNMRDSFFYGSRTSQMEECLRSASSIARASCQGAGHSVRPIGCASCWRQRASSSPLMGG